MLKLKNVSKFYYSKGIVTSGFSKISLDFNLGEFVAITGESGSGKSTLLNVLSGLDSYEEGEMYINDKETSHYTEKDYEIYRKKYIGNIFQNYNLVNSYTVYQNVELVLLLNGARKKDIKNKVLEIIKSVDLYKYRNRRVSKLSGGQKQRVAIARALAKDTPIILADEPTGNLDSRSSESVLKLLSEVAKDKLVIIVTHNYDQIEKYVTRKITMHDGKVLEDKKIKKYEEVKDNKEANFSNIKWYNKIRLGIRNTFNVIPKFLLIFIVYFFILFAFSSAYASFKESEYETNNQGYNQYFQEISDKRIIIKKEDKTEFTEEDYDKIAKLVGVDYIVKNDLLLDNNISLSSENLYYYGNVKDINSFEGTLDFGRMPENDNEVIIEGNKDSYMIPDSFEEVENIDFNLEDLSNNITNEKYNIKVVGIHYVTSSNYYENIKIYVPSKVLTDLAKKINKDYSTMTYTFAGKQHDSYFDSVSGEIRPSGNVPRGTYIIPEEMRYQCKNSNCKKYTLSINIKSTFFTDSISLSYKNYYKKSTFNKLIGLSYDKYNGSIFINTDDYNNLFNKGYYQSSVFLDSTDNKTSCIKTLNANGYTTLYVKDTLVNYYEGDLAIVKILKVTILGILLIVLFFISYFIIKIILKSRNVYFATLRILGSPVSTVKELLDIELFTICNIAYVIFLSLMILINKDIIVSDTLKTMYSYLTVFDYILVYIVLFLMSKLITDRYSRKLFKTTAMNAYREEA